MVISRELFKLKKVGNILLLIFVVITLCSCAMSVDATDKEEDKITIIYYEDDFSHSIKEYIKFAAKDFTYLNKVDIEIQEISDMSKEDYLTKLGSKLILEDGPTLILEGRRNYDYWKDKPFYNVRDIPNYKRIIPSLKSDKFIPIMSYVPTLTLNKKLLQDKNVDLAELDTREFLRLKMEYYKEHPVNLDCFEFRELMILIFDSINFYDEDNLLVLTEDEFLEGIQEFKDIIFSDGYIMPSISEAEDLRIYFDVYNQENKKEIMQASSKRRSNPTAYALPFLLNGEYNCQNLHYTREYTNVKKYELIPSFLRRQLHSQWGFLINPNGKNLEQGVAFIDYLLSDEVQFHIFVMGSEDTRHREFAPVVNSLEEKMQSHYIRLDVDKDVVAMSNEVRDRLDRGYYDIYYNHPMNSMDLYNLLIDYTFTDKYLDIDTLKKELKKEEVKINFYD